MEMPILRPVPIPTKGLSFWKRIGVWRRTIRKWEVMKDWECEHYCVLKGFIFDGASIPRALWWFLSPTGLLLIPGLIHDHAYRYGLKGHRKYTDQLFRENIKWVTGTTIIPWIAWAAVRLGGWKAWNKHRRNDA